MEQKISSEKRKNGKGQGMGLQVPCLLACVFFLLLLLPVFYLSFFNRATGDDYGYGTYTRAAFQATHSLIPLLAAVGKTVKQYYLSWQGTWFSVAVFSLQPEVFHDRAYVVVVFLMLFLWIASTLLLFFQVLHKQMKFDRWSSSLCAVIVLTLEIEFIPSTKSAIFWFNGTAHYMLPFAMCQVLAVLLFRFAQENGIREFIFLSVIMTLLGGSNYQAALFGLVTACYIGGYFYLKYRNKKLFLLGIPIALELIGLVISMKSPGNKVRGGEDFGFSFARVGKTILGSFAEAGRTSLAYLTEQPLIVAGLLALFLVMLIAIRQRKEESRASYQPLIAVLMICLYCAMFAPAEYAGVGVSGGVYNMNYQVFLLTAAVLLLLLAAGLEKALKGLSRKRAAGIWLTGLLVCLVFLGLCRSGIKETTSWNSLTYAVSGQAEDYREQMELQTRLLTEGEEEEVVVPMINDWQGPLMQMPVTEDPMAWSNRVTAAFYGKKSVTGIPREEWIKENQK